MSQFFNKETAPDISDANINHIDTKNMVYWYNNNWEIGFDDALESVETTFYGSDGKIYTGGSLEHEYDLDLKLQVQPILQLLQQ